MSKRLILINLVSAIIFEPTVFAHDFWIEPSDYRPDPGTRVELTLRVGDHFVGTAFPRDPHHLAAFVAYGESGRRDVDGVFGRSPAGRFKSGRGGTVVVGYRSTHTTLELEAEAFEAYLQKVGLDRIIRTRAVKGESTKEGLEAYSRYAKAILSCGSDEGNGFDRRLGFELEIIPESNPYGIVRGEALPVRVLFGGRPLSEVRVAAIHEDEMDVSIETRTDTEGRTDLRLDRPGVWMVTVVHMFPARESLDADWESLWASLTFELTLETP